MEKVDCMFHIHSSHTGLGQNNRIRPFPNRTLAIEDQKPEATMAGKLPGKIHNHQGNTALKSD